MPDCILRNVLASDGQRDEAMDQLAEVLRLDSGNARAKEALAALSAKTAE